ncbi:MAG: zinc metalloprotease [Planctomycetota bacterium]
MKRSCALVLLLLPLGVSFSADRANGQQPRRCATPVADPAWPEPDVPGDCAYSSTNPTGEYATGETYRIPVVVHIITTAAGTGFISEAQVRTQIDVLNEDFRAQAGSPGAPGFDTGIEFFLATTDPSGQPTNGITYSQNDTWFLDRGSYWTSLAWDTSRYLNIYTNSAGGALGYVPGLPQTGVVGARSDRVVILWSSFGRPGPIGPPYNRGRTTTHEVGHYLGLWHTFDRGCGTSSCYTTGDTICDTPSESQPHYGCPSSASCGTPDPVRNYMNYSDDSCMFEFTSEQSRRMRCTIKYWRPRLAGVCATAGAVNRNPGTNPQSYTAAAPVLGASWTATVDLSTTGHTNALVLGYLGSADIAIGGGLRLLVDPSSGLRLALPGTGAPLARVSLSVPATQSLCGYTLYTQALHYGGGNPGTLSNALDLTFGQ